MAARGIPESIGGRSVWGAAAGWRGIQRRALLALFLTSRRQYAVQAALSKLT